MAVSPFNSQYSGRFANTRQKQIVGMWLRLVKCYNLAMRMVRDSLRDEITLPQFDVLSQLSRMPDGLTFSQLSKLLLVTAGNLTGIIDRLEAQGLVKREQNPKDRRETFIKLTTEGRKLSDELIPKHENDIVQIFGGITDPQLETLRLALGELRSHLEALDAKNATRESLEPKP